MAILSDDSVIELTVGQTDDANDTIKVEDLVALIKNTPVVKKYEGQVVNALAPLGNWVNNQTLTITVNVEINP